MSHRFRLPIMYGSPTAFPKNVLRNVANRRARPALRGGLRDEHSSRLRRSATRRIRRKRKRCSLLTWTDNRPKKCEVTASDVQMAILALCFGDFLAELPITLLKINPEMGPCQADTRNFSDSSGQQDTQCERGSSERTTEHAMRTGIVAIVVTTFRITTYRLYRLLNT